MDGGRRGTSGAPDVERVICAPLDAIERIRHLTTRRWSVSVSRGGGEAGERYENQKTVGSEQASSQLMDPGDDDQDTDPHPTQVSLRSEGVKKVNRAVSGEGLGKE